MISSELPKDVVQKISKKYNMTETAVRDLYKGWWKYVRQFIESQDLSVPGQFNTVSDINVPHIGSFHISLSKQVKSNNNE